MEFSYFSDRRAVFSPLEMFLFGPFDDLIAPTISVLNWVTSLVGSGLHVSSVATMMSFVGMQCGVIAKFNPFDRTLVRSWLSLYLERLTTHRFICVPVRSGSEGLFFFDFEIKLASLSCCLHFACLCTLSWTVVRCVINCCWTSLGNRSTKRRFLSCRWLIFWFVSRILSRRRFFLAFSTMFLALTELIGHFKLRLGGMTHSSLYLKLNTKWFLWRASWRVEFSAFRTILMVSCPWFVRKFLKKFRLRLSEQSYYELGSKWNSWAGKRQV